jgi:hypothetical protein
MLDLLPPRYTGVLAPVPWLYDSAASAVRQLMLDRPRDPKPLLPTLDQWMAELGGGTSGQAHRARQLAREVRGEVQPSMTIEEHTTPPTANAGTSGCQRRPRPARPYHPLPAKRDARRTLPAARGILRGDRRREAADDQG